MPMTPTHRALRAAGAGLVLGAMALAGTQAAFATTHSEHGGGYNPYYLRFAVSGGGTVQLSPNITVTGPAEWSTDWYTGAAQYTLQVVSGYPDFTGWSGDCTGAELSCTVTMTKNHTVTAHFADGTPPTAGPITVSPGLPPEVTDPGASSGGTGATTPGVDRTTLPVPPLISIIVTHNYVPATNLFDVTVGGVVPVVTKRTVDAVRASAVRVGSSAEHATTTAKRTSSCRITRRVKGSARAFRCGLRLPQGTWNVTTKAMSGTRVVGQSTRTVIMSK